MARVLKWIIGSIVMLAFAGVLVSILLFAVAKRTVQPLSGEKEIAGLSAPVSIVRDKEGVPHIAAQSHADAALALGFTHAQDRLWQMELLRMTGQGRLSELFGENEDVQSLDVLLRTLGFLKQAEGSFEALTPASQVVLKAYAQGVNAFLTRETRLAEPQLPPEFLILGHAPEPWRPEHSLIVLKIMALNLSKNMGREIDRLRLAAHGLSGGEIDDIFPYHAEDTPPPLPNLSKYYPLIAPKSAATRSGHTFAGITDRYLQEGGRFASNNWVLAGGRTKSGKPLLANDPHLSFNAPSLWYLAHLQWPDKDGERVNVVGGTIPSVPAVVLGRNDHIAWGFTNAGGDAQDLFVEKLKDGDPNSYLTPSGWQTFETQDEVVKVKGGKSIAFTRKIGRHGPVLPGTFLDHGELLQPNHVLSLSWTGLSDKDRNFDVVSAFASAKSVEDFASVVGPSVAPMQVMVVADTAGSIGLFAKAALPKRKPENEISGRAPVPGWLAVYDWDGLLSPDTMPAIKNPVSGALGSANTKFVPNNSAPFLTYDWAENFRHKRLLDTVINRNEKADMADMKAAQLDAYSPPMARLRDYVVDAMAGEASQKARIDGLSAWDGHMMADAPEPLMMVSIFRHAHQRIFADDLGPAYEESLGKPAESLLRVLDQGGARPWCDDIKTRLVETCAVMLKRAWTEAMTELETAHGQNWKAWRWGAVHTVSNEHQPFGKIPVLRSIFDIERPANGGAYALQRAKYDLLDERPYRAVHGAGYRALYDFENLEKSLFIQTTGQSGNAFSRFYDSFADRWASGNYITISTKDQTYRAGAVGEWNLSPVGSAQ